MKNKIITFLLFFLFVVALNAQENEAFNSNLKDRTKGVIYSSLVGVEYRLKAGFNIGGTTPLPLPAEIREIKEFHPKLNMMIEAEATKSFKEKWGFSLALRFETKGMETKARVRNYNITMVSSEDGVVSGVFTGIVNTEVSNSYLTLPLLAMWKPHERIGIKLGPYCSFLLTGKFSGSASNGYLREGNPTGNRVDITSATYEFSDDLRRWNLGIQTGAEWKALSHLLVSADLMWGLSPIFKKDFDIITFEMYPIFASINFGYIF